MHIEMTQADLFEGCNDSVTRSKKELAMVHLCKNCHTPLSEPFVLRNGTHFCKEACARQWRKLSLEEARALHWAWVREEARINQ